MDGSEETRTSTRTNLSAFLNNDEDDDDYITNNAGRNSTNSRKAVDARQQRSS